MRKLGMLIVLAGLIVAGGCASFTKGTPVVQYKKGGEPIVTEAPVAGEYALFSQFDSTPKTSVPLEKGEPVGFATSETGKIKVIAGERELNLPEANYVWKRR